MSNWPDFILRHWRGQQSLKIAFWVNFVFITLLYNGLETLIRTGIWQISVGLLPLIFYLLLTRLVIFPWQLVGLIRTYEKYFKQHGQALRIRSIQTLIVVSIIINGIGVINAFQWIKWQATEAKKGPYVEIIPSYSLSLSKNTTLIYLKGTLDFGVTADLELILAKNPQIRGLVMESIGGVIAEGRGLFRLLNEYTLDTWVYGQCSSACALAFIGGKNRYLAANAKLGFHQYALQQRTIIPDIDVQEEQKHDLKLLRSKQISAQFLQRVFQQPSHSIWFPSAEELLKSGVITALVTEQED